MDSDNKKISALIKVTSLSDSDLFVVTIDPGASPLTRGIQKSNVATSGTYTPTLGNVTNVAASTVQQAFTYIRVGSIVYVSGSVSQDATSAATLTVLSMTLPIASNFATTFDANGTAASPTSGEYAGAIISDAAGDIVALRTFPISAANLSWRVSFMYIII